MLGTIVYRARLWLLKRNETESLALRRWFKASFNIEVGLYSYGCFDRWRFPPPVVVGRYCSIADSVRVVEANHPIEEITTHPVVYEPKWGIVDYAPPRPAPLIIGDGAWIGHAVTVLPKCRSIGRGAIIGAGAVVTRDVPAYAIVAGNPAQLLRYRFSADRIAEIERTKWWELNPRELKIFKESDSEILFGKNR